MVALAKMRESRRRVLVSIKLSDDTFSDVDDGDAESQRKFVFSGESIWWFGRGEAGRPLNGDFGDKEDILCVFTSKI